MKILVTGANGFIGRALCAHLLALGHEVVPTVRHPCDVPEAQLVGDDASWAHALVGCDSVVHLAGRAHVMHEIEPNPLHAFRAANVTPSLALAHQAVAAGVRRLVFVSTAKVHGECTAPGLCFRVQDTPSPKDPYALSKWEAEQGLREIANTRGLELITVRPPLVYGPGVKGNLHSLIQWVKRGIPLPLGSVENSRSLLALDNLLDFFALCVQAPADTQSHQTFLVSDGDDVSTSELLRRIARAYGVPSRLLPVPSAWLLRGARCLGKSALADRLLESLVLDNSMACRSMGWQPRVTMAQQLTTMAYYDASMV